MWLYFAYVTNFEPTWDFEVRWVDAQGVFLRAAGHCLMRRNRAALDKHARDAWCGAYAEEQRPTGLLGPEQGQRFAATWQRHLTSKMRSVCQRFVKPELFFAARLLLPENLEYLNWPSIETTRPRKLEVVRTARRIASDAALLYGRNPPQGYSLRYGGGVPERELEGFGKAFLILLSLSETYFLSWLYNAAFGLGFELEVSEEGFQPSSGGSEGFHILINSRDRRTEFYYSPFTRIGEFYEGAEPVQDPHERGTDTMGLMSARYQPDETGRPGYRFQSWPLEPLQTYLTKDLNREVVSEALAVGPQEFIGLLGGLCLLTHDRLQEAAELEAAHASSVVPFEAPEIEGEKLLESARRYLEDAGVKLETIDLATAQASFLYLTRSMDKGPKDPVFLQTSVGNTRYSYLLHRFGRTYALDLMHADHWLHRIMDLLANKTREGKQASLKGKRVEEQIWGFFGDSPTIERIEDLKGYVIEHKKGKDEDDLDCPLKVGSTLVLAETKGHRLHYETESVGRRFLEERWKDTHGYLDKIDETAKKVAERQHEKDLRERLNGVERILPVLCRPYPEWIPSSDREYWLRPPTRDERGVPRILTPKELKEFLESATDDEIAQLPGEYMVRLPTS